MNSRSSVGRRLFVLIIVQTATACLLVLLAMRAISALSDAYVRMYTFQLQGVAAIGEAIAETSTLKPGSRSAALDDFYHRYRSEWEVASGNTPDAIEFRKALGDSNATHLLHVESSLLTDLNRSLNAGDPEAIHRDLTDLYDLNI